MFAIARSAGVEQGTLLIVLCTVGAAYFALTALIIPYRMLRTSPHGLRVVDHLGATHELGWRQICHVSITRVDGKVEWLIRDGRGHLVLVMENERLFRRRLVSGFSTHLIGFDLFAVQDAVKSNVDGLWPCFERESNADGSLRHSGHVA